MPQTPKVFKHAPAGRRYAYVVGPLPPQAGDAQGGHRTMADLDDAETNDYDNLEALAVAVYRALHRTDPALWEANSKDIPPGFQVRLLRVPTALYNAIVDEANGAKGAMARLGKAGGSKELMATRYVLRLPHNRWQFSDWGHVEDVNLGGYGDPGIGPADSPFPLGDGQHRLN